MNGKAKGQRGEKHHRFHDCRTDADRWKRLGEILMFVAEAIDGQGDIFRKAYTSLTRKLGAIVASLQEVKDELDSLKADTAAEHAQFAQVQQALADKIAELQAIIDAGTGGATPAQLDDLLTGLQEVHAQVSAIVPDEPTA